MFKGKSDILNVQKENQQSSRQHLDAKLRILGLVCMTFLDKCIQP